MPYTPQNWKPGRFKLNLLALLFICVFIGLGMWQLSRAAQKRALLNDFAERALKQPLNANTLRNQHDWRFYRIQVHGTFDNAHTLLLDNKTYEGKIGYQVYTPFLAQGIERPILIDRGFVPIVNDRRTLPIIHPVRGEVTIIGMLNVPPAYVAWGQINESTHITWPLRIEYVNLTELTKWLTYPLSPYIINLSPEDPAAYAMKWQIVTMRPETHTGYAIQWFAFALTLLIISAAMNRKCD
jgi:surfeit locus 1 family protein